MLDLKPDDRWACFLTTKEYESFVKSSIPEIWFKPEVPKDVKSSFEIIRKLLLHSWFVYEFYDEAATKALMVFEMALKLKYEEVEAKKWKGNLQDLLKYFRTRQYFEADNQAFFDQIRQVRNIVAHPSQHSFGGAMKKPWIELSMGLTNDLYEDIPLRVDRIAKWKEVSEFLYPLVEIGAEMTINHTTYIIGGARLVFVDNKQTPEIYYFGFVPVFTHEERAKRDLEDIST